MPRAGRKARNKAAKEDAAKLSRKKDAQAGGLESDRTRQRAASEDDCGSSASTYFDVFHYEPKLETTDYHLFEKLKFYVLPSHSLRQRPGLGYVRVADMVYGAEPLPHPVELSCGVFACMKQPLSEKESSPRYPEPCVVRRAVDTGRFLRCTDFREYLKTMTQTEFTFWEQQMKSIKPSPLLQTLQTILQRVADPLRELDLGELCERLAILEQSYGEEAGHRVSLLVSPELPAHVAAQLYSLLHGLLERTFDLFLTASEGRELPPPPPPPPPPAARRPAQDGEWSNATQLMLSSSTEDLLTSESSQFYICCCSYRLSELCQEAAAQNATEAAEKATEEAAAEIAAEDAKKATAKAAVDIVAEDSKKATAKAAAEIVAEDEEKAMEEVAAESYVKIYPDRITKATTAAADEAPESVGKNTAAKAALEAAIKTVAEAAKSAAAAAAAAVAVEADTEEVDTEAAAQTVVEAAIAAATASAAGEATASLKAQLDWAAWEAEYGPTAPLDVSSFEYGPADPLDVLSFEFVPTDPLGVSSFEYGPADPLYVLPDGLEGSAEAEESVLSELELDIVDRALRQLESTLEKFGM